jgi:hypothetical protein
MKLTRLFVILAALAVPAAALAADHAISGGGCPLHGFCPFC